MTGGEGVKMNLVIRPAVAADEDAIAGLHAESWRGSYHGVLPDTYLDGPLADEMREKWRRRLASPPPGWLVLISTLDDAFGGFIAAFPDPDDPSRDLVDNLHVVPGLRGHGIGAALIREGADRLAAMGRRRAILRVVESNAGARAFYRDLGGINAGARAFYRDLGGIEGARVSHAIAPGHQVALVPYHWDRMQDIATYARRRLARRLAPPLSVTAEQVVAVSGRESGARHPVAAGAHARPRRKQRLGDAFGLTDYGVNRVELDPRVRDGAGGRIDTGFGQG
jgi:GNAT superfamily N-acetyltransferase